MRHDDELLKQMHAIAELQSLAKKHPLKGADLEKAKRSMAVLREFSYTNQEISTLTGGAWSEPTIKLYSRGAEVKDSSIKQATLNLLSEVVAHGLSLNDVKVALFLKRELDSAELNLTDISVLLSEATKVGLSVKALLSLFEDVRKALPGASIDDMVDVTAYKTDLIRLGIGTVELKNIVRASRTYGEPNKILEAINSFGSIKSMEDKIEVVSTQKNALDEEVSSLRTEIKELENKKAAVHRSLEEYDYLRSSGFDHSVLAALQQTFKKFRTNARGVLDAVNAYANLVDIQVEVDEVKAELRTAKEQNAHLQTVMNISNTLLFDLQYSISDIRGLHDLAKKYGRPEEAYNALSRFSDLGKIESQIQDLLRNRTELDSNVKELKIQLEGLRAHAESIKELARGSLQPLSAEMTKMVESGFDKITSVYAQQHATIKKETEEYGKRIAEAKIFEEELNMARVLNSIIKYPTEAKHMPLDYVLLLLDAVEKVCWAKRINPRISLEEASITTDAFYSGFEIYLHQLIFAARTALLRAFV